MITITKYERNPLTRTYYFQKPAEYSFRMDVIINDDKHESNFIASMVRKGYTQVEKGEYDKHERIKSQLRSLRSMYK